MKFIKISSLYSIYLKNFYDQNLGLSEKIYQNQKEKLDFDAFGTSDHMTKALSTLGYQTSDLIINAVPLQKAWMKENIPQNLHEHCSLHDIVLAQLQQFNPDILWFDEYDASLLKKIKESCPNIRLVLGWVGSSIPLTTVWEDIDLILSCAPESVEFLQKKGYSITHLNHAFEPGINSRLKTEEQSIQFSFFGEIIRGKSFHLIREQILEQLIFAGVELEIFSSSYYLGAKEEFKTILRMLLFFSTNFLGKSGIPKSILSNIPIIKKPLRWPSKPMLPVSHHLKPFLKPPVYGLDMYQNIKNSHITLNIHADSSPTYASNMRLFETTGVGTCLVTDRKKDLSKLLEPDKEVVTYNSAEECAEKVLWLLDHPKEKEAIAKAGQERILKEHTFAHRAIQLHEIIQSQLG